MTNFIIRYYNILPPTREKAHTCCNKSANKLQKVCSLVVSTEKCFYIRFFLLHFVQLERANDGFSVVADYFGRGVFNKVRNERLLYIATPELEGGGGQRVMAKARCNSTYKNIMMRFRKEWW